MSTAGTSSKRPARNEVAAELKWDLTDLFSTEEAWEADLNELIPASEKLAAYEGTLNQGKEQIISCLTEYEELIIKFIRVSTYSTLKYSVDGTDKDNQINASRVGAVSAKISSRLSFIQSELSLLSNQALTELLEDDGIKRFRSMLEELLAQKPYQLSPETEKALAALGQVLNSPYAIYQRSKTSDMTFEDILLESGEALPNSFALFEDRYEFSKDTETRRKAYESFSATLNKYENTFAAVYETEVTKQVTLSKLRGFDSVTDMLLHSQQVTKEMYHNQLDVIQDELAPHMRKLARLRKKVLGLDKMTFADLKAPLDPDFNPSTTFENAGKVILDSLQVMGPEYLDIMQKGLKDNWVDLADNIGKSTGAFCSSPYGVHPYILMTWTDTMRGAFVLTHELGHAGHFYLAGKNQSYLNTRPSRYFIEAPSTMNELLLGRYLLRTTEDKRMKRWVILQFLGTYYHNFVTHLLEGELQRRVYQAADEGKALNATLLRSYKQDILCSFWGDAVEIDDNAALTWMRQPHYYMELYPYTYSAGLTASTAVSKLIEEEGQPAVDRWLEVLKAGGTKSPLELLQHAGVDMSTADPIKKAVAFVGELVNELEKSYVEE
ncbi:oligoendopeptidase F [Jeotgalibacillus proteolyticus]|uniref:Oligopeptidase F n=1 Tax=Jeotgalibacillus proteolyticus TaxID=2082395 RepID=A0A2S5GFN1_9BACL|nr:oligoendopeptidase F [Jeotgalibacillus proteolyticus]PPA71847.1 oligoendopeptidase F [Jeotgalibacillus proteolyticus]